MKPQRCHTCRILLLDSYLKFRQPSVALELLDTLVVPQLVLHVTIDLEAALVPLAREYVRLSMRLQKKR